MKPEDALNEQIRRYQQMTDEQRLALALELHELSCNVTREGIRHQNPKLTMRKSNVSCVSAFGWLGNDRAGTAGGLPPPPQWRRAHILPDRLNGQQLLGSPTHDSRSGLRHSTTSVIVSAFSPDYFLDERAVGAAYQPPHQFNAIDTSHFSTWHRTPKS